MAKVEFKDLEKLAQRLKKLGQEEINRFNEAAVKELAARLLRKVKLITPKGQYPKSSGKKGGTLRREWTIGEVEKTGGTYSVEVINPMDYASYVEYGHRRRNNKGWTEGQFMLTKSEQELESDAQRILEKKLEKFLGEVFQ